MIALGHISENCVRMSSGVHVVANEAEARRHGTPEYMS